MLYSFLVQIDPAADADIGRFSGFRLGSALLDIVRRHDPALSDALHDPRRWPRGMKPYTVSAAERISVRGPLQRSAWRFRVTLLQHDLLGPLVSAITQHADAFHVDGWHCPVRSLDMDPRRSRWSDAADVRTLLERAPTESLAHFFVASPAAFRSTRRGYVSTAEPALIVASLLQRWDAYAGHPINATVGERLRRCVRLEASDTRAGSVEFKGERLRGFTGLVSLLAPDAATGGLLHALVEFGFYSGIGIKAPEGMGQLLPIRGASRLDRELDVLLAGRTGRPSEEIVALTAR